MKRLMWTPNEVLERIASRSLLPDCMFEYLDADAVLDARDRSFDGDWLRAAEDLRQIWEGHPIAAGHIPEINKVREMAFKRAFDGSGGHHDLAATVSDDFDLICRRALIGVELPFITALEHAYDAQQIPAERLTL